MVGKKWLCVAFFSLFMASFANASLTTTVNAVMDLVDQILTEKLKAGDLNSDISENHEFNLDIAHLRSLYASLLTREQPFSDRGSFEVYKKRVLPRPFRLLGYSSEFSQAGLDELQARYVPAVTPGAFFDSEGKYRFFADARHHAMLDSLPDSDVNRRVKRILSSFVDTSKESIFVSTCSRFGLLDRLQEIVEQVKAVLES